MTAPRGLSAGGRALWRAVTREHPGLDAVQRVQLVEACRIKDRLDKLDELLCGDVDAWCRLSIPESDDGEVVLKVDGAIGEARQQATVLKQLLAAMRLPDVESGVKPQSRPARGAYKPTGKAAGAGAGRVSSILDRMQA